MQHDAYLLVAEGSWCNDPVVAWYEGANADTQTLKNCQNLCTQDQHCAYLSYDSGNGWCSTFPTCNVLSERPNSWPQDNSGWVVYVKSASAPQDLLQRDQECVDGEPCVECKQSPFPRFRALAADWYDHGIATIGMFHELSIFLSNYQEIRTVCAPAALLAVLLKLELLYFEEQSKWDAVLGIYLTALHEAVGDGSLLQSHHDLGWPLSRGISNVLALRSLGSQNQNALSYSQQFPPVPHGNPTLDIVICYCAERLSWLRAFHRVPWRDEDRSHTIKMHVGLRIYHKCGGFGAIAREKERQRLVDEWGSYFSIVEVRYVDDAVRADDCSAYLAYIADRYHDLPPLTVFLHADAPEHIPDLTLLTDVVFASARGFLSADVGFMHLAHNFVLHESGCKPEDRACDLRTQSDNLQFHVLWKHVFGSSISPSLEGGQVNAYCCVQFLVRAERIRLRPHSFYTRALQYFGSSAESYHRLFPVGRVIREGDVIGRTPCQLAMYIWHAMFGEELKLPRRQKDPRLPLFVKFQNIEIEALGDADVERLLSQDASSWNTIDASRSGRLEALFEEGADSD